ncbi:MAG: YceI family protein [Polyangiales bacterium]
MNKTSLSLVLGLSLFGGTALAENNSAAGSSTGLSEWAIDASHAHVGFSVPHMVISEVEGKFKTFSGTVQLDEKDLTHSKLQFSATVASIDTDNAERDKHLKSADFFAAEQFPQLTFSSTKIVKAGKGYKVTGDLTIHGVTKSVTLDATLSEAVKNPWGKQVRAAKLSGKVDRRDFGLSWNKTLDQGGLLVGDEVAIDVKLELNK